MFRTAFSSLTVTVKGFFSLKAQTIVDLDEKEALAGRVEKIISTAAFSDDDAADGEDGIKWMAEPLTDKETREKNAESMRVRWKCHQTFFPPGKLACFSLEGFFSHVH
jgi:hypothetical protein